MEALTRPIQIGPIAYEVQLVERLYSADHTPLYGEIDYAAGVIRISAEQSPVMRQITLWHELLHGILSSAGIAQHNETIVDAIAHGIVDALQRNPLLATPERLWKR